MGGYPEPGAITEANSMIGKHYDLTGWHQVCPGLDSSTGCRWIEKGRFVTDQVIPTKAGYTIIHVTFEDGASGYMEYVRDHAGISSISVEEYLAEKDREQREESETERCVTGIAKLHLGMSHDEVIRAMCPPKRRNTAITGSHVRDQWIYDPGMSLYFDNGKLTSIHYSH